MDPTNDLAIELDDNGQSTPALVASGNVTLGGQFTPLVDDLNDPNTGDCPTIPLGTTDTIIQSTGGSVSGTFQDANGNPIANGGYVDAVDVCGPDDTATDYWYQIAYTGTSVTATAVSAAQATAPTTGPTAPVTTPPATTAPVATPPATTAPAAGTGVSTVAKPVSKRGSTSVTVPIDCAAGGASCTVTVKVTAVEKVKDKKGKSVSKTVVIGTRTTTVAAGVTA